MRTRALLSLLVLIAALGCSGGGDILSDRAAARVPSWVLAP